MVSTIVVIAVIGVGWMVWKYWGRSQMPAVSGTAAGVTPESLAFDAFTRGNTCLAEGKFADAIAAFQQARELDPKRPHVADRLAEAERRQAGASPPPPVSAAS